MRSMNRRTFLKLFTLMPICSLAFGKVVYTFKKPVPDLTKLRLKKHAGPCYLTDELVEDASFSVKAADIARWYDIPPHLLSQGTSK